MLKLAALVCVYEKAYSINCMYMYKHFVILGPEILKKNDDDKFLVKKCLTFMYTND